jgi:hypothetical protein
MGYAVLQQHTQTTVGMLTLAKSLWLCSAISSPTSRSSPSYAACAAVKRISKSAG